MSELLAFLILGLGVGAVTAGFAQSLVIIYKGTRVINFAQAGVAMWGIYVYDELTRSGDLHLPLLGIPSRIHTGAPMNPLLALVVSVASAVVLGVMIQVIVLRRLAAAPVLSQVVATIGVLLVIQGMCSIYFGTDQRSVEALLPRPAVQVAGQTIGGDRLILAAVVCLTAALSMAWFRWSRTGLACRAAAETRTGALVSGLSPARLAVSAWVLASAIAGLVAVLSGPLNNLSVATYPLLVVPALAAALVGRLTNLGIATGAGLALGCLQSLVQLGLAHGWLPNWAQTGLPAALPLIVIVVVLIIAGQRLPARGTEADSRLPKAQIPRRPGRSFAISFVIGLLLVFVLSAQYRLGLLNSLVAALLCASLVVLTGFLGKISFAQSALAGMSAFVLSKLADGFGIPFPLAPVCAIIAATLFGVAMGLPALRVRGVQLSVVTLALSAAVVGLVFQNTFFTNEVLLAPVPPPSIGGYSFGPLGGDFPQRPFVIFVLTVVLLSFLGLANLLRGETGQRFLAVRSSERAAAAVGLNVVRVNVTGYVVSSAVAAIGGVLLGYLQSTVTPDPFDVFVGLSILALAYLGGIGSLSGAAVGGFIVSAGIAFTFLNKLIGGISTYYLLITGIGLVLTAMDNPDGVVPRVTALVARLTVRWSRAKRSTSFTSGEPSAEAPTIASRGATQ